MDRSWYLRFAVVITAVIAAWLTIWPTLSPWVSAPDAILTTFTRRIALGLDIQGGMRLAYEVEVDEAVIDRRDLRAQQIFERLCERFEICDPDAEGGATEENLAETRERVRVETLRDNPQGFRLTFTDPADADQLDHDLVAGYDLREASRVEGTVTLEIRDEAVERLRETAVEQARETIAERIDELGLREASVMVRDTNIVVELPGASDEQFDDVREIIGRTARLEFLVVDDESDYVRGLTDLPEGVERTFETVSAGEDNPSVQSYYLVASGDFVTLSDGSVLRGRVTRTESRDDVVTEVEIVVSEGADEGRTRILREGSFSAVRTARQWLEEYITSLEDAGSVPDDRQVLVGMADTGEYSEEDAADARRTSTWRTYFVHRRTAVTGDAIDDASVAFDPQQQNPYVSLVFTSAGARDFEELTGANVRRRMAIVLDDRVETAPVIQSRIGGGRAQITLGGFRPYNEMLEEANELVVVLRAGALPAPIRPSTQQHIGPTLGADSVAQGLTGALIGVLLVLLFMGLYYEVGGVVADVMVLLNLLFLLAILAAFEGTLTLPGIAGVALTIGMAVDANVLINERIREELKLGKTPRSAVEQGFDKAFWSIFDSQLTTFIAGVVLFQYGTGPIRGFAVTLMIGIVTSLFSGVFCSKVMFDWIVRGLRVTRLRVG